MLTAADGISFDVWLLEAPTPRATLLICHGYYANRDQVLALAERLRGRGYESVLFELRGHGSRPGPCTFGIKESEDADVVLRWATARHRGEWPIGVIGFSMGAVIACQLALRHPTIRAVVTDSAYSRFFPVLQRSVWRQHRLPSIPFAWIAWWMLQLALRKPLGPLDPAAVAARLHQPLLAIQGGEDQRVPPQFGEDVYARWAGPKERWCEPTASHVGLFDRQPQAYGDRLAAFFDRTLGGV